MNIETRNNFREEAKSIALYRREVKRKSKELFRESALYKRECIDNKNWEWDNRRAFWKKMALADSLRHSKKDYARALNVALGLMKGTPYKMIEASCHEKPSVHLIHDIINTFAKADEENNEWTKQKIEEAISQ